MDAHHEWAHMEFSRTVLGDARRTARLVSIAAAAARRPAGLLTRVFQSPADREAAYRFVESDLISADAIGESVFSRCAERCAPHSGIVVAVDQSAVSITDRLCSKGLGRTGHNNSVHRGFEVMTAVATSARGECLGVLGQAWHRRPDERTPWRGYDKRPRNERESALWLDCIRKAVAALDRVAPDTRPWFQLDRGGDANDVLQAAAELDADFTVRSAHDRRLDTGGHLLRALRNCPALGQMQTTVVDTHAPAGVTRSRSARLLVRARPVVLRLQNYNCRRYGAMSMNAVRVTEIGRGRRTRIEWLLLTTVDVRTLEDACKVVQAYRGRWHVEEFHRAWKSGVCEIETSQLRSAGALRRWATILAAVAARAERLRTRSRTEPDAPATEELSREEIDAAILLTGTKAHRVGDSLSLEQAVELVALAGGYTGRRNSGGPPGISVITRGLHDVTVAAHALAAERRRSGQ